MHAFIVGLGIFLSRVAGLVRDRVFAHYLGNSDAADAFRAAFRIPNFLQNLFGEGVLSASFIPVYARLEAEGKRSEAAAVAGAIAGVLSLIVSVLVVAGILAAPILIDAIAPGFSGEKKDLCVQLVKIFFPGAGILVFSALCLGILNSHGKFFLSYTAPVLWNTMIIISLIVFGSRDEFRLAQWAAWGAVAGSLVQLLVQLPTTMRLLHDLRISLNVRLYDVRTVIRNFIPVFMSRGVVQISGYIDSLLASFLPTGAVAALAYAQILYTLPVSLFGMSVSAAELPAMSRATGGREDVKRELRMRLENGTRRIAFFIVPSVVGFLSLGDVIASAIYQTGRFTHSDAVYVWTILAGSTIGLLAATLGRLYASAFYALRDTRTPLKFAFLRVVLASALGYFAALHLPTLLGISPRLGVVGITAASGMCGWLEYILLKKSISRHIGKTRVNPSYLLSLWLSSAAAAAAALIVKVTLDIRAPIFAAIPILGAYGLVYFAMAFAFKIPEIRNMKQFLKMR